LNGVTAIAGSAHAEDGRTQMFDDPNMNACWFGEASGCEAWARADGYATMSLICHQIGKADRCMPVEPVFYIIQIVGFAQALAGGETARIAAIRELLDRGYGRSRQAMEISAPAGDPLQLLFEELDALSRKTDRYKQEPQKPA
jgi:hypothetical protein